MYENPKYDKLIGALKNKAKEVLPKGSRMVLYGSRARGDASPESDWDIHILIPGEEKIPFDLCGHIAFPFEEVGWDFEEMVNAAVYSYAGWQKIHFLPYYKNVEQDKIILFQN